MPAISFLSGSFKQVAYTPVLAGTFAWLGARYGLGVSGTLNVFGYNVDTQLGLAGVVAASAFVGELGSTYVLPHIPRFQTIAGFESDVVAPTLTGVAAYELLMFFGSPADVTAIGTWNLILLGGLSHLIARKSASTIKNFI